MTLQTQEKRLILKALRICKGDLKKAYKINVPCGIFISFRTYKSRIENLHNITLESFKNVATE